MLLTVNYIKPYERLFAVKIKEDKELIFDDPTYRVIRKSLTTNEVENTFTIKPLEANDRVTISYDNDSCYLEYVDNANCNGRLYHYVVERDIATTSDIGTTVDTVLSNEIIVETMPSLVKNFRITDSETIWDSLTSIPTHITLEWDEYDRLGNNQDALGFEFYYSESLKGLDQWTPFEKIRDSVTVRNTNPITRIPLSSVKHVLEVPQLSDSLRPKDIKITIVAVGAIQQSVQSNEAVISTHNMAGSAYFTKIGHANIINGYKEDTDEQVAAGKLINPHYAIYFNNSLREDGFVWCERYTAHELKHNIIRLEYCVGATKEIIAPYVLKFYLPLPTSFTYEVRVGKDKTPVPCEYDYKTRVLTFSLASYAVFEIVATNNEYTPGHVEYQETFRETTRTLIKRLPTWFKMRRNPTESIGAYFLEVFGIELEEIEKLLDYVSDQTHIVTLDDTQLTQIYKIKLPDNVNTVDRFAIQGDGVSLERCDSLSYFLKPPYFLSEEEMVYHNNLFLIDYDERIIYTRKSFKPTKQSPYGEIMLHIYKEGADKPWFENHLPLEAHKMWNFYDEFGLLLDVTRLKDETNAHYKERILDVFKNPSSATRDGLLNGIARELNLRKTITWSDTTRDLVIQDSMVICNKIKLNGEYLPVDKVWIDNNDYIVIKADKDYPRDSEVTYVVGIEMHALNNKTDRVLQNQLFHPNGLATTLLLQYVKRIKDSIPVEWGSFRWNEGYWDANLPENGGMAFVPSIMDASISGFKNSDKFAKSALQHYKK